MPKKIEVYQIEESVPIPVRVTLPIAKLEVGQSLLFPLERRPSVASQASKQKARTGKDFTIRKVDESNCRIWRIK